jgi:erythromycin esterase-like protein
MYARDDREKALMAKIHDLTDGRVAEVEDFVDFLRARDEQRELVQAATVLSEASLATVWDNPDDNVYDAEQARLS